MQIALRPVRTKGANVKTAYQMKMKKFFDWHKSLIERAQNQFGLSNYALYLSGILEGAIYMWIILKIIPLFFGSKEVFPDF